MSVSIGKETQGGNLKLSGNLTTSGDATCNNLSVSGDVVCNSLRTTAQIDVNSIKIDDGSANNHVEKHHTGSIFYFKYSQYHEVTIFKSEADGNCILTLSPEHGKGTTTGLTVHVIPPALSTVMTSLGLPIDTLDGAQSASTVAMAAKTSSPHPNQLKIYNSAFTTSQTFFGSYGLVRIDNYVSIDLLSDTPVWTHSSTPPVATHINAASS